jgi:RNA polymerase sigma-32 factor
MPYFDASFNSYIAMVDNLPALEREDELELARRYQDGDSAAGHRLVEAHLRSVVRLARRYGGYNIPIAELVAEGNIGLLEAVKRFEPERELRFFTYARYWVRAYILAYVLQHWSIVDMGTTALQSKLFFRLKGEHARLTSQLGAGHESIDGRLATQFGTSVEHVRTSLQRLRRRDRSLDAPVANDSGSTLTHLDLLPSGGQSQEQVSSEAQRASLVHEAIDNVWSDLDERERMIVNDRLLPVDNEAKSLAALGRHLGVTRERVRQIEVGIKKKLRTELDILTEPARAQLCLLTQALPICEPKSCACSAA